jgi:peptidoglycan/LPS O-acetylase OafA/YrhL
MGALYALRFFAAFGIYIHHLYYPYGFGSALVTFFFIISGFTTACSFSKKGFILSKNSLKKYYVGKFIKLYPLHIITFILSIPIMGYMNQKFNLIQAIVNVFLVQSYYPNGKDVFLFNGLSWFIADVLFFYLVIPFIYKLITILRIDRNIFVLILSSTALFCIAFFLSYYFRWNVEAYTFGWWLVYVSPYFRLIDCLIGFLIGLIFTRLNEKICIEIKNRLIVFTIIEIFSVLLLYLAYKSKILLIDSIRYGVYYIPVLVLFIFVFAFDSGIISKVISIKPFVYLGKISNAIYMIHQLIIYYTTYLLGSAMFYSDNMGLNNYLAEIFLFIIVLCVSDVFSRNLLTIKTKMLSFKKIRVKLRSEIEYEA